MLEAVYTYSVQLLEKEHSNPLKNGSKKRLLQIQRLVMHILCRVYRNEGLKQKKEIESICVSPNAIYIQSTFRVFENLLSKIGTHKIRGKRRCKPQKSNWKLPNSDESFLSPWSTAISYEQCSCEWCVHIYFECVRLTLLFPLYSNPFFFLTYIFCTCDMHAHCEFFTLIMK